MLVISNEQYEQIEEQYGDQSMDAVKKMVERKNREKILSEYLKKVGMEEALKQLLKKED